MRNLFLILPLLIISCGKNHLPESQEVNVEFKKANVVKMDDFVESVDYIVLENTKDSKLSRIHGVYLDEDNLIVHASGSIIYIFDQNGNYKCKINKKGRARDEYIDLSLVSIDSEKDRIVVYDGSSKKLLFYSYNGDYINSIENFGDKRSYPKINDIITLPNGTFLCATDIHFGADGEPLRPELWINDAEGNLIRDLYVAKFHHPIGSTAPLLHSTSTGDIIYINYESDSDFLFRGGELQLLRTYNLDGPAAGDYKGMGNGIYAQKYWVKGKTFHARTSAAFEGDYAFAVWSDTDATTSKEWYTTLLNVKSNKLTVGKELDYQLSNTQRVYPSYISKNNGLLFGVIKDNIENAMVSVIDPTTAMDESLRNKLGINDDEVMDINPIIQLLRIKKN